MIVSHYGRVEVVDTLLQHGARVDFQRKVNSCGFMLSCNSFNLELFALFGNYYNTRTIHVTVLPHAICIIILNIHLAGP